MIPTPAERIEEWLRLPIAPDPADSPFLVGRARPEEFEQIWDVVDAAFGKKRPRALYDWLYRQNPTGLARVWTVRARATGQLLKAGAGFPWPIWRGEEVLLGSVGGDAATIPEWQRKGLSAVRRTIRRSHPWTEEICSISGPNEGSRAVMRKSGRGELLLGRLRGGVASLRADDLIRRAGVPKGVAAPIGRATDAAFDLWRRWLLGASRGTSPSANTVEPAAIAPRIEVVQRFTSEYDDVTLRTMSFPEFWCPHNAEWLNWRYLDHPGESYVGLVSVEHEMPTAYAVVLLNGKKATLSEFAASTEDRAGAGRLLGRALDLAREAGCHHLNFFGTPGWRHWPLFYRAGFIPYPSPNQFEAGGKRHEPDVANLRNWQITPGDRDYH